MKRFLFPVLVLAAASLMACEEEHGRAPDGQYRPAGPVDDRGNAATSRALGGSKGSAEPPRARGDWQRERQTPENIADLYDAGGSRFDPGGAPIMSLAGTITGVSEGVVQVQSDQGQSISLRLDQYPEITREGVLISLEALRPGARILASYRPDGPQPAASSIELVPGP